ncbi:antitoxin [Xylophilus sp.]|uniref:antitoxin n=1 Tax=Xylophilus sp. TaxID=2653893 RepID=UPI0013B64513|nr:virulence-associated protein VapB [Xylophilus sp.]KAF1047048.1 MAG: hypothetical protein GAK38_02092 [Xylophilus sp.]
MHPVAEAPLPSAAGQEDQVRRVRLFRNGANQAVRIPREFELPAQEAILRKVGDTLVLEPVAPLPRKGSLEALQLARERIRTLGPWPEGYEFPDADAGQPALDDVAL